jgi:Putative auto-transporter adhesin, head GIN domain
MAGMRFRLIMVALVAISTVGALGCHRRDHSHRSRADVKGSGSMASEQRTVGSFHGVELAGIGTVIIKQGEENSVRVEADDNVIGDVATEVEHGILTVRMTKDGYHDLSVKVYVTTKELDVVRLSGAGKIESAGDLKLDDLKCALTGAGSITLKGSCRHLEVSVTGVGSVSNGGLVSEKCRASVTGVGAAEVNATQELDASVSGVGQISYEGNPRDVSKSVSGLGTVERK